MNRIIAFESFVQTAVNIYNMYYIPYIYSNV